MIWLLTMKHSGTHYMFKGMEQLGFKQSVVRIDDGSVSNPDLDFVHLHICEVSHRAIEWARSPVIVTMRNPIDVYKSHVKRHRVLNLSAYDNFNAVVNKFNPFIFRVDGEDQQQQFDKLAEFLNTAPRPISVHEDFWNSSAYPFDDVVPDDVVTLASEYGY